MRVGYVRVSTVDQNTVRQLDGVDVERVFADTASGKDDPCGQPLNVVDNPCQPMRRPSSVVGQCAVLGSVTGLITALNGWDRI